MVCHCPQGSKSVRSAPSAYQKMTHEFRPRTLKEREQQLRVLLMEAALCPIQTWDLGFCTQHLLLASLSWEQVLRKDSSRDAWHHHGSSHVHLVGRHRSQSPVPQKKKKPEAAQDLLCLTVPFSPPKRDEPPALTAPACPTVQSRGKPAMLACLLHSTPHARSSGMRAQSFL